MIFQMEAKMKRLLLLTLSLLLLSFLIFAEDPQGDASMPADMSADFPGMDQMPAGDATPQPNVTAPADASSDFPGMDQMPADGAAPQTKVTAPADASSDFPGMEQGNPMEQIQPATETKAAPI